MLDFLRVDGISLCGGKGQPVRLRGVGLGGWMNMENFITGYPGAEEAHRQAMAAVLGPERHAFFFDKFLEFFFSASDAAYLASLGVNALRLPINYHHFEDDDRPFVVKESGFGHLDRVIDLCTREGIYCIIDLHSAPGGQNEDWHCDNPTHKPLFWRHRHFQERTVHLWKAIARRYRDNPAVAGYNLLNEPNDASKCLLRPFYQETIDAIRAVDSEHVIFLDGNLYATDFTNFDPPFENVVYAIHDYTPPGETGAPAYPGLCRGEQFDHQRLAKDIRRKCQYMLERGLPIWVGEFGPQYAGDATIDAMRRQVAIDQIAAFEELQAHWCIWPYKDLGLQALVYLSADSPWMVRIKSFLEKKARLAADCALPAGPVNPLVQPLIETLQREVPNYRPSPPPPWGVAFQVNRLVRGILFSEALQDEFAGLFRDASLPEIGELMRSFLLERCVKRRPLADVLQAACRS